MQTTVSDKEYFLDYKRELQDYINQCSLAHSLASSQEEWEVLFEEVLKKHNLQDHEGLTSLLHTPEEERSEPSLKVVH